MKTDLIKNEDGTYTLTLEQIQELSDGIIKLINGQLYMNAGKIPASAAVFPGKTNLVNLPFHSVHNPTANVSDRDYSSFNRPTQAQIERMKKIPNFPEIKGVHLKSSKLSPDAQMVVEGLISEIDDYPDKHPFEWIRSAEFYTEFAGEEVKSLLLEILNLTVPLKEGMKLEGFSAKEFDEKYLHSRPSLLEQATEELKLMETGHKSVINMIDARTHENLGPLDPSAEDLVPLPIDDTHPLERPVFLSPGLDHINFKEMEQLLRTIYYENGNDKIETFQQFAECAGGLYGEYTGEVKMMDLDDPDPENAKWNYAIYLQKSYWVTFRGRTITILKLFNKFLNPGNKLYHLETPIEGMKKR